MQEAFIGDYLLDINSDLKSIARLNRKSHSFMYVFCIVTCETLALFFRAAEAYRKLRDEASYLLSQIYNNNTVTEWLSDKIDDRITDAEEQKNKIESVESSYDSR